MEKRWIFLLTHTFVRKFGSGICFNCLICWFIILWLLFYISINSLFFVCFSRFFWGEFWVWILGVFWGVLKRSFLGVSFKMDFKKLYFKTSIHWNSNKSDKNVSLLLVSLLMEFQCIKSFFCPINRKKLVKFLIFQKFSLIY